MGAAFEDLAKKFATMCERQDSLPVVSLEEFFEGNDVRYSMGANLSDAEHPGVRLLPTTSLDSE